MSGEQLYRLESVEQKQDFTPIGASITVVIFCWHICLISKSMGHHDSEIMDDRSID